MFPIVRCVSMMRTWPSGGLLLVLSACGNYGLPNTDLFRGVDKGNYEEGKALLTQRLEARFPAGSSALELKDYLQTQGLSIDTLPAEKGVASASYKFGAPICGSQVRVVWEADNLNRLRAVEAVYGDTGCP